MDKEKAIEIIQSLIGCIENDKCEEKNCVYFTKLKDLMMLLEYLKNGE